MYCCIKYMKGIEYEPALLHENVLNKNNGYDKILSST